MLLSSASLRHFHSVTLSRAQGCTQTYGCGPGFFLAIGEADGDVTFERAAACTYPERFSETTFITCATGTVLEG